MGSGRRTGWILVAHGVDTTICSGIGSAQNALARLESVFSAGLKMPDEAVNALLAEILAMITMCIADHVDHHGEGHSCGDHGCETIPAINRRHRFNLNG